MPDAPKKRPLYQLHLSTCVVLMFVAGTMVWLNLVERRSSDNWPYDRYFGWPWTAVEIDFDAPYGSMTNMFWHNRWRIATNLSVCLPLLTAVAFVCEYCLRLRERRHG